MESRILAEPVLVGRERELQELMRCLALAKEGKGKTVFISAEAGIGKTRLVNEFLKSAKQKETTVTLFGWCLFNAGVPYFPFIEAFSSYYSTLTGKSEKEELELNSWLNGPSKGELSGKLEHFSPRALKDHTFVAVSKTIQSIATRNPVILFIEDIHWADSASLALIHYIARAINNSERVLILATYRSEELTIDSQGFPHQLIETLCMMRREDLFNEIKLAKLDQASVIEMAESMLGGCLDKDLAEKIATKSEGNPLFVVETLRMLHEQRIFAQLNNKWGIAVNELNIPSKIKDIITKRLACLNSAQRRILDAASVIGEEFDVGLLSALIEQDSLDVLETLNVIAYSTSLVIADENQYKFDHARSREIIYETLAQPLRRGYHGRIGEIFERSQSGVLPLGDLAYHYARAGNREKVAKYALAAGKDALAKWSNAQAIEHFQTALQNIAANKDDKRTALEGLGDAYAANYMYAEAIKVFDKLASCSTGLVKLRAFRKATDAAYAKGDMPDLLFEYAEKAEKIASSNRLEMARVFNNRARAFAWAGRGNAGLDLADYDSALQVFEEENSLADMAEALSRSGELNAASEDLSEKSLSALLRSVAIFRDLGDSRKEIEARMRLGFAFGRGLFSEARCELANILRDGDKSGAFVELARAHGMLSLIDESEGELSRALSHILKAFEYCKKTNVGYVQALDLAALTRLYCKLGDSRIADEYFEKLIELPPEATSSPLVGAMTLLSKGVYFAFKGKWEESNQAFAKYEKLGWKGFDVAILGLLKNKAGSKRQKFSETKLRRRWRRLKSGSDMLISKYIFWCQKKSVSDRNLRCALILLMLPRILEP